MKEITEAQVKNVDRKLQISFKTYFIITFKFSIFSTLEGHQVGKKVITTI